MLETVLSKLKYSITLAVSSVFLIYLISLPLGIWSAVRQNTVADKLVTFILFMLYSLPSFFVAVILLNALTVGDWAIEGEVSTRGYTTRAKEEQRRDDDEALHERGPGWWRHPQPHIERFWRNQEFRKEGLTRPR